MSFTPTFRNGTRVYVAGMAASSIAAKRYALSTHDECGTEVAWATSSRTGRDYPCEVAEYMTEGGNPRHRAMPYQPHTCPTRFIGPLDTRTNSEIRVYHLELALASIADQNNDHANQVIQDMIAEEKETA